MRKILVLLLILVAATAHADLILTSVGQTLTLGQGGTGGTNAATARASLDAEQKLSSNPVWDDVVIPATSISTTGKSNPPTVDSTTDFGALTFVGAGAAGTSNDVSAMVQMPHAVKHGPVYPHIHLKNLTAGNGTPTWELWYRWSAPNGTFATTYTVATVSYAVPASTATHQMVYFPAIDLTNSSDSAILMMVLRRCQGATSDTSTTDINLLSWDLHVQKDSNGSTAMNGD